MGKIKYQWCKGVFIFFSIPIVLSSKSGCSRNHAIIISQYCSMDESIRDQAYDPKMTEKQKRIPYSSDEEYSSAQSERVAQPFEMGKESYLWAVGLSKLGWDVSIYCGNESEDSIEMSLKNNSETAHMFRGYVKPFTHIQNGKEVVNPEGIQSLLNAENEMDPEDELFVYYQGHGLLNGNEHSLQFADKARGSAEKLIDIFFEFSKKIPKGKATIFFNSCHSSYCLNRIESIPENVCMFASAREEESSTVGAYETAIGQQLLSLTSKKYTWRELLLNAMDSKNISPSEEKPQLFFPGAKKVKSTPELADEYKKWIKQHPNKSCLDYSLDKR